MFGSVGDSDQSISEEEDLDVDNSRNCAISLGSCSESKERSIPLLSQIETLEKVYCESNRTTKTRSSLDERQQGLCIEDDIEFPVFINEDTLTHSPKMAHVLNTVGLISTHNPDEDNVYQEENESPSFRFPKRGRDGDAWSEASKEFIALAQCEKTGLSLTNGSCSKPNKSFKAGGKVKSKARFSFRSGPYNGEYFPAENCINSNLYPADMLETKVFGPGDSRAKLPEDIGGIRVDQPPDCDDHREHSVAELLDSLHGRNIPPREIHETHRWIGKRKMPFKRNNNTGMDHDMLMSSSSEEDDEPRGLPEEDNSLNRKSAFQRSMVDHFQDVFDAVAPKHHMPKAMFERQSGNTLFERVQNVVLIQKEADTEFLQKSEIDLNLTEEGCLNVKILSRSLEAKLTVCCCSSLVEEEKEKKLTVIFDSRACNGVELDVGNMVRIFPIWREVNIKGKDESVILSSYFRKCNVL